MHLLYGFAIQNQLANKSIDALTNQNGEQRGFV